MEELKTLKDLKANDYYKVGEIEKKFPKTATPSVSVYELRQEVIKWIKEMEEKGYCWTHEEYHLKEWVCDFECNNTLVVSWIKHFFNLTEEEILNAKR